MRRIKFSEILIYKVIPRFHPNNQTVIIDKKEMNLPYRRIYLPNGPQCDNQRKRKGKQVLKPC